MKITGLAPLLEVFDMPTSLDFYSRVLEFGVVRNAGPPNDIGWALLRRDGFELMLNTAYELPERPASPDPKRVAAHADTTLYLSCPDVDAVFAHLQTQGLDVRPPTIAPYGMKQLYLRDPDGYALCFQWPAEA